MVAGEKFQWLGVRQCHPGHAYYVIQPCPHLRKFGNHVTVHRPSERASDRPPAQQGNQCLLSHFLASLGHQEETNCTSMLWSIDSCQNRVSVDQYHLTVARAQVSPHRSRVFFEVIRWQITSFKWSQAPMIHTTYVVFISLWPRTVKILIWNWPRTPKFSKIF